MLFPFLPKALPSVFHIGKNELVVIAEIPNLCAESSVVGTHQLGQ